MAIAKQKRELLTLLEERKGEEFWGIRELSLEACKLIDKVARGQTKYKVSELPTEKAVRDYRGLGIVDEPLRKESNTDIYGYQHLLQVLAVKMLQTEHYQLGKIKDLLEGKRVQQLEELLMKETTRGIEITDRQSGSQEEGSCPPISEWIQLDVASDCKVYLKGTLKKDRSRVENLLVECKKAYTRYKEDPYRPRLRRL